MIKYDPANWINSYLTRPMRNNELFRMKQFSSAVKKRYEEVEQIAKRLFSQETESIFYTYFIYHVFSLSLSEEAEKVADHTVYRATAGTCSLLAAKVRNLPLHVYLFSQTDPIGEGGSKKVFRSIDLVTDQDVVVSVSHVNEPHLAQAAYMEANMQKLFHEVFAFTLCQQTFYAALPLANRGTLASPLCYIEKKEPLILSIIRCVKRGHTRGIIFNDIKLSNILLHETPEGELIARYNDFGLSYKIRKPQPKPNTSTECRAPEHLNGSPFVSTATDIFQLGLLFWKFYHDETPWFYDEDHFSLYDQNWLQAKVDDLDNPVNTLFLNMMHPLEIERPTIHRVLYTALNLWTNSTLS